MPGARRNIGISMKLYAERSSAIWLVGFLVAVTRVTEDSLSVKLAMNVDMAARARGKKKRRLKVDRKHERRICRIFSVLWTGGTCERRLPSQGQGSLQCADRMGDRYRDNAANEKSCFRYTAWSNYLKELSSSVGSSYKSYDPWKYAYRDRSL